MELRREARKTANLVGAPQEQLENLLRRRLSYKLPLTRRRWASPQNWVFEDTR